MPNAIPWDDYTYRVVSSEGVTPVIREVTLAPTAAAMPFRPGQYALLSDCDFLVPQRSYSMANAPRPDGTVSLLVTLVPDGPTSTWVHRSLHIGDEVALSGPFGTFVLDTPHAPVLLVGAGSGLAPVRALAQASLADRPDRTVTLIQSVRTRRDRIDHERFTSWAAKYAGFRYIDTLTRDPGAPWHERVPALLPRIVPDLTGWQVFASGPPGFITGCAAAATALGARPDAIHTEEFFADPQPWSEEPCALADSEGNSTR